MTAGLIRVTTTIILLRPATKTTVYTVAISRYNLTNGRLAFSADSFTTIGPICKCSHIFAGSQRVKNVIAYRWLFIYRSMTEHNVSERAQISDEIQQCQCPERIVITLKRQFNALLPVSIIPVEVLCEIFLCRIYGNRQGDLVDDNHVTKRPLLQVRRRRALHLSHVCHHWRDVALSTSKLWVHMMWDGSDDSDEWTKELLVRAGRAPLVAYLCGQLRNHTQLARLLLILEKMDQIEILYLNIAGSESQLLHLYKLMNRNASLLRSLYFEFEPAHHHLSVSLDLSFHSPRLSRLSLSVNNLTTSLTLLTPSLRTLKLVLLKEISASLLFSALAGTPSLRSLTLHGSSVIADGQQRCVELDHLQYIRIQGDAHTAAFILESIKTSKDLSIHLDCSHHHGDPVDWSLFLSNMSSHKFCRMDQDGSQDPFDVLRIRYNFFPRDIETEWWRGGMKNMNLEDPDAMSQGRKPNLTIILHPFYTHNFGQTLIPAIHSAGVKALFLKTPAKYRSDSSAMEFWSTFIRSSPNLRGLWITDSNGSKLVDSILLGFLHPESNLGDTEKDQDRRQPNPRYVPIPQLHSLHLNTVRFRGRHGSDPSQSTFATLLRVFGRRQRAGVQLPYISIFKCTNIGEEDIQVLDGAVRKVVWDEEETFDDDSDL